MKLFKILSQVTLDNYFRIVDKTGAVLFEGSIDSKSSMPLNLLNAKVAFFRPININDDDVSDEVVTFAGTVLKYNSLKEEYDSAMAEYFKNMPVPGDSIEGSIEALYDYEKSDYKKRYDLAKQKRDDVFKSCLAYMVSLPTEITLKVLRCDLNGEIDII